MVIMLSYCAIAHLSSQILTWHFVCSHDGEILCTFWKIETVVELEEMFPAMENSLRVCFTMSEVLQHHKKDKSRHKLRVDEKS